MESKVRLLIVDDDAETLRDMAISLSLEGYFVMTASSGVSASILLTEHDFDVVITDLRMPIMDGHEIVRRTRASHPETSIIITSSYLDDETRAWMANEKIIGLEKPFNVHQLSAILRDCQIRESA